MDTKEKKSIKKPTIKELKELAPILKKSFERFKCLNQYAILQITENSTKEEITSKFNHLYNEYKEESMIIEVLVNAHKMLTNDNQRQIYDTFVYKNEKAVLDQLDKIKKKNKKNTLSNKVCKIL
ncbi:hypothetical protein DICPUDRAFT_150411 [Dictyostelium purpureum]|uniref:J domain-containing protein n=1 Tax=Dictyostelium purpureum TaxID=5786 RepID=F0ZG95_DICPU|nr:uncharacterized protein DICPUDRAFT_150411 [Dictyostelium purpureum]EGC37019.1 hypothetical protein DICPUDRAFT_150411 [Dictyostelium purpureum]|eukprot:XP_003286447.1 hypothetical protein DICPUDRAFT_150411 [Dictyostelium purpureum]